MERRMVSHVDPNDNTQYVDETENPEIMLKLDPENLFVRLGLANFQIETRGYYNPNLILETYWGDKGREVFKRYATVVKAKICKSYEYMKESGVLDTAEKTYFFVAGLMMASDVPRAVAACVAAIIAKQGLHMLCKEE